MHSGKAHCNQQVPNQSSDRISQHPQELPLRRAGQQWQATVDRVATSARSSAAVEAEEAARAARKHVYILAGYAEPPAPSLSVSGQNVDSEDQPGQQKGDAGGATGKEGASKSTKGRCVISLPFDVIRMKFIDGPGRVLAGKVPGDRTVPPYNVEYS